jgi:hypothetical protein
MYSAALSILLLIFIISVSTALKCRQGGVPGGVDGGLDRGKYVIVECKHGDTICFVQTVRSNARLIANSFAIIRFSAIYSISIV